MQNISDNRNGGSMAKGNSCGICTLTEALYPKDTNPGGYIFGGVIMSLMDKAAGVAARSFSKKRVVTVNAERITFHTPIEVGEVVHVTAKVISTGHTSLTLEVVVVAEDAFGETSRMAVTGIFTMVALDEAGKPTAVDPQKYKGTKDTMNLLFFADVGRNNMPDEQDFQNGLADM